jgi:hypothetical protein
MKSGQMAQGRIEMDFKTRIEAKRVELAKENQALRTLREMDSNTYVPKKKPNAVLGLLATNDDGDLILYAVDGDALGEIQSYLEKREPEKSYESKEWALALAESLGVKTILEGVDTGLVDANFDDFATAQ